MAKIEELLQVMAVLPGPVDRYLLCLLAAAAAALAGGAEGCVLRCRCVLLQVVRSLCCLDDALAESEHAARAFADTFREYQTLLQSRQDDHVAAVLELIAQGKYTDILMLMEQQQKGGTAAVPWQIKAELSTRLEGEAEALLRNVRQLASSFPEDEVEALQLGLRAVRKAAPLSEFLRDDVRQLLAGLEERVSSQLQVRKRALYHP